MNDLFKSLINDFASKKLGVWGITVGLIATGVVAGATIPWVVSGTVVYTVVQGIIDYQKEKNKAHELELLKIKLQKVLNETK